MSGIVNLVIPFLVAVDSAVGTDTNGERRSGEVCMPRVLSEIQGMITVRTGLLSPKRISAPRRARGLRPTPTYVLRQPGNFDDRQLETLSGCSAAGRSCAPRYSEGADQSETMSSHVQWTEVELMRKP